MTFTQSTANAESNADGITKSTYEYADQQQNVWAKGSVTFEADGVVHAGNNNFFSSQQDLAFGRNSITVHWSQPNQLWIFSATIYDADGNAAQIEVTNNDDGTTTTYPGFFALGGPEIDITIEFTTKESSTGTYAVTSSGYLDAWVDADTEPSTGHSDVHTQEMTRLEFETEIHKTKP